MDDGLSPTVRSFVFAYIDSIEMLEIVLSLAEQPDVSFTAEAISERLRTSPSSAHTRLVALHRQQLVDRTADGRYLFSAGSRHREVLQEVAAAYRERRVRIVNLIYSRPSEVVTVFADAFLLRRGRGKKDGGDG